MVSLSSLRGYVLEELLASLLKSSGYDLIVHSSQDPAALTMAGNGLRIRGRGADHQVDVLGQLRMSIPFMHRLRLFVEAKYRTDRSDLADVRNAVGVINDINEHYSWALAQQARPSYIRYQYRYALFSASGFTEDARRYAITQQVSLIDLSSPAFEWLRNAADRIARAFLSLPQNSPNESSFPVWQVREALRRALGTWPLGPVGSPQSFTKPQRSTDATSTPEASLPIRDVARIASEAADLGGALYLAFTDAPFILVLQPDDVDTAAEFLRRPRDLQPESAELRFGGRTPRSGEWVVLASDRQVSFRLALPPDFEPLVLGGDPSSSFPEAPVGSHRSVVISAVDGGAELRFAPLPIEIEPQFESSTSDVPNYSRATRLDTDLAFRSEEAPAGLTQWTPEGARELLRRLRSEGRNSHAVIIESAAANGGVITRADVYAVAGYPPDRTLRGFTRPTRRITLDLITEGLIDEDVDWPLLAQYATGVLATHFIVPPEFTEILDR